MNFTELQRMDGDYIAHTYARFPVGVAEGEGAVCRDTEGREYIDFTSGIGVNSLGFCHPAWVQAVQRQAATLCHISNLYYTAPDALLAKALCERTGCSRVFFANSGAEANEGIIKAARKYGSDHYGPERCEIITLENSFHGRTIATLAATGQEVFHKNFGPFPAGFVHTPAGDIDALRQKVSERTCGILIEMVQGEGGVIPLDRAFTDAIAEICAKNDILLMVDEVQTGMGRTGTLLACEQYGLRPDLVSLAKGLGGGLPIGAALLFEKCKDVFGPGDHGTTFGGNPIVCAGANAVMECLTGELLAEVRRKSARIFEAVAKMPRVKSVAGLGLMIGVEFDGIAGRDVVNRCLEEGVIFLTAKHKLRMLPPLVITDEQIDRGLAILNRILTNWEDETK
ncbi:aspartate aminotransferase family protein [Clostridiaceae bacterium NSJ-31]|uniref:Acetylornithine aminotransferase n=3 Tax=Ligaoa zhengdingensis TaxID=2763658 RepID=A0A926E2C5_9FIRM|nr:aspartate aminotransferase family protein [Ligaoa zhengdingensis]MBC8547515.1 aspartate aminotransferase family protein [Ligaoa zhengdingensis]